MAAEPLEQSDQGRLAAFPIQDSWSFAFLERCQSLFWVHGEINQNLKQDRHDWPTLSPDEQRFIKHILAFFAVSDAVVNQAIADQLAARIQPLEIRMVYNYQRMVEDIHNVVYSKLVETYTTGTEREQLLDSVRHFPVVRRKVEWYRKHMADTTTGQPPLARVLLINCIMEGLFFSGSFCAIFWVGHYHKKLPGLTKANEFISRDEGLHTEFGLHLYTTRIRHKLSWTEVRQIMEEAVDIENAFVADALPSGLRGMNAALMQRYVCFVADQLLVQLGYRTLFGVANPFPFMQKQSVGVRSVDFFQDAEVSEYGHHAAGLQQTDEELSFTGL